MNIEKYLRKEVRVVIDRPIGSKHPDFDLIYPLNYGYISGASSEIDNEPIDAYVLGPKEPLKKFTGKVIAIVKRVGDEEKLVVANENFTQESIEQLIEFQEKYFKHDLIIL
ncbi:MAG: inorganic diphosphatase [Patescibacteria group bacterium]|jgi:inorganic pyrophosphatase